MAKPSRKKQGSDRPAAADISTDCPTQPERATPHKEPINPEQVNQAIESAQSAVASGKSKAEAVRLIFPLVFEEPKEVILQAFVDGAGLTEKGAVTYLYNVRRAHKKGRLKTYFEQ
jgi:hypothetical protein